MRSARFFCLLAIAIFSFSSQAFAQSSNSDKLALYPQYITCTQTEDHGVVTDRSINHSNDIVMKFEVLSGGEYSYNGVAKNGKDEGGGESANVFYDATTGNFLRGTYGIVCPPTLSQTQELR